MIQNYLLMLRYFSLVLFLFLFTSCAAPLKMPSAPITAPIPSPGPVSMPRSDVVHIVAPGETLWRIGRMYDVAPADILHANQLSSTAVLKKGARLLIPNAAPVQPVITLYPTHRWKYIIVHHSATDEGDALFFDKAHLKKGWDGVGYDFVIDNGSKGRVDGQIEVSPRWLKQLSGAHCKANGMNEIGIGICLVGNFNETQPTRRQMEALTALVNKLRRYYKIPESKILGHGQVPEARTDCPGKKFPWETFKSKLRHDQSPGL